MADRKKLIELLRSNMNVLKAAGTSATATLRLADNLIDGGVTIPVRCEECEKWIDGLCYRYGMRNLLVTRPDGYCDGGKRRINESSSV